MPIDITDQMITDFETAGTDGCGAITNTRAGLAAVLDLPEVHDAFYADGVHAERERVRHLLSQPLLAGLRSIPDGEIRNGCLVHDGGQVREKLRAAYRAVVDGDETK